MISYVNNNDHALAVEQLAERVLNLDNRWIEPVAEEQRAERNAIAREMKELAGKLRKHQAGPVALPEPVAKRSTTHGGEILCEPVYSAEQLRAYGNDREAAGRAVAVPLVDASFEAFNDITGLCSNLREGGPAPEDLEGLSSGLESAIGIAANMLAKISDARSAPIPHQPAAEGAGREAVANSVELAAYAIMHADSNAYTFDHYCELAKAAINAIPTPAADAGGATDSVLPLESATAAGLTCDDLLSEWVPGNIKPSEQGSYLRQFPAGEFDEDPEATEAIGSWDGIGKWKMGDASDFFSGTSPEQSAPWCGVCPRKLIAALTAALTPEVRHGE